MGATEDQLKHDAEMQRERMGDTLEAIGDRLSPERMVERRKAAVGQTFRNMKESVMGSPGYQEPATERLRAQAGCRPRLGNVGRSATRPSTCSRHRRRSRIRLGAIRSRRASSRSARVCCSRPFSRCSRTEQRVVEEAKPQLQKPRNSSRRPDATSRPTRPTTLARRLKQ